MLKTWCLIRSLYKCICKNLVRKLWTVSAILMLKLVTLTMQDSPKYLKRAKFPPCCSFLNPKAKLKLSYFFLKVATFLQIIFVFLVKCIDKAKVIDRVLGGRSQVSLFFCKCGEPQLYLQNFFLYLESNVILLSPKMHRIKKVWKW
jgi:hypothetical protein